MPSINARIVIELVEKHGLKKSEVARKMGITPAAVTQYLNGLRENTVMSLMSLIDRSEETVKIIEKTAKDLANLKLIF